MVKVWVSGTASNRWWRHFLKSNHLLHRFCKKYMINTSPQSWAAFTESTKRSLIQIRVYHFSSLKFELPRLKNTYLLFLAVLCPRFFRESDILQEESTHFTRLRKIYVNIFVHHCTKLQRTSIKINSLNDITWHTFLSNNCHVDSSDKIGSRW